MLKCLLKYAFLSRCIIFIQTESYQLHKKLSVSSATVRSYLSRKIINIVRLLELRLFVLLVRRLLKKPNIIIKLLVNCECSYPLKLRNTTKVIALNNKSDTYIHENTLIEKQNNDCFFYLRKIMDLC